jgi:lipooligosaccharide transport system ATP-binding protein
MRLEPSAVPAEKGALAVEAASLTKKYGELIAVDSISFQVEHGETFGFLGPNGAGKSTTMRMIYCRTPLTSGKLVVEGLDVTQEPSAIKALVGVVPQDNNLDPDLNVIDNLLTYARYFRIPLVEARRRALELLDFLGLSEKLDVNVEALSGGMKRRLVLARALMNSPTLLVLDEPTTGLDPQVRHAMWERLRELRRRSTTVVISTHYMEEAERLCDRLIVMDYGQILAVGRPAELISRYALNYVLEIQEVNGRPLVAVPDQVRAETHGVTHYYFAAAPELLSGVMKEYSGYPSLLRPANLEDVFLRLTGRERIE